jgi:hypothetical protein
MFELQQALDREAREGDGIERIIPVALDNAVFEWKVGDDSRDLLLKQQRDLKPILLERVVADFRNTQDGHAAFEDAIVRVLKALRNDGELS